MYKLLQNQAVRNFRNEINALGWEEAGKQFPAVKASLDVRYIGSEKFTQDMIVHYTHVADIDANTDEDAFLVHNNPAGNPEFEARITRYGIQHSMSVGDILVSEEGHLYMVEAMGFAYVGDATGYTTATKSVIA